MAANTGRTVSKWFKFQIEDSGDTLRDIPVWTFGSVGINHDQIEQSALQDELHGFLPGHGTLAVTITGPFDNTVVQAASGTGAVAALSGSHTVLNAVNGLNTPLGFGFYFGNRQYWETGEPVFGLIGSATNGILVSNYQVTDGLSYSATIMMAPASATPAWGTAAIT